MVGNAVPFTGAAGDNLPNQDTAVTVQVMTPLDVDFDGDKAEIVAASFTRRGVVVFEDSNDVVLDAGDIAAGEGYVYVVAWPVESADRKSGRSVIANGDSADQRIPPGRALRQRHLIMQVAAVIPARGGSKGIPRKNLQPVGGIPLIGWAVRAALAAETVDVVYVSTDSHTIAKVAGEYGARVIMRPAELAADETPTMPVIEHAVAQMPETPEIVVILQCTSPLTTGEDIDLAVGRCDTWPRPTRWSASSRITACW